MSIFIDTGIVHAWISAGDQHRQQGQRILQKVLEGGYGPSFTSTFVVDEALTLLKARRGNSRQAGALLGIFGLKDDEGLPACAQLVDITAADLPQVAHLQLRHWDRGLSFTDCASLHVMERDGIDAIATFDTAFEGLVPVVSDA